jgi:hypothetical protein
MQNVDCRMEEVEMPTTGGLGTAVTKVTIVPEVPLLVFGFLDGTDSLAPARSALAGFWLRSDSFRCLPGGSSHRIHKICNVIAGWWRTPELLKMDSFKLHLRGSNWLWPALHGMGRLI